MNLKLIMLCSFFLCSLHGLAQQTWSPKENSSTVHENSSYQLPYRLSPPKPELAGKVLIVNPTGNDLYYNISVDKVSWKSESLRMGYTMTYTSPGFTFSIQTPGKTALQYSLTSGYSYSLGWNKKLESWDIYVDP